MSMSSFLRASPWHRAVACLACWVWASLAWADDHALTRPGSIAEGLRSPSDVDFAKYPARAYTGAVRLSDFKGRDRAHRLFRTRIRQTMLRGPNFAGHMAVIVIGCGMDCSLVYLGNVRTGQVDELPLSGEAFARLALYGQTHSRLLMGTWDDIASDSCYRALYVWRDRGLERLAQQRLGSRDECDAARRVP